MRSGWKSLTVPYLSWLDLHQLKERFPERPWPHLSMGMTDDFEVAIEEGATIVRIGRAIFGARNDQWED